VGKDARSARAPITLHSRAIAATLVVVVALLAGSVPAAAAPAAREHDAQGAPAITVASVAAKRVEDVTRQTMRNTTDTLVVLEQRRKDEELRGAILYVTAVAAAQATAKAQDDAVWDRIAACETGGNWQMQGSRFSGGVGFANTTWNAFGGREFAPNAGMATRDQQIVVAERVRANVGLRRLGLRVHHRSPVALVGAAEQ
jgi:hypothetical protein